MPSVQIALEKHTIIVAGGTSNAFVAEELLKVQIEDKSGYTMGIVTKGELGISQSSKKTAPYVISEGQALSISWKEYLSKLQVGDIFIKGGNAVDHTGLAAVMVLDSMGGKSPLDESFGHKVGLIPMIGATVVTELTALGTLYESKPVALLQVGSMAQKVLLLLQLKDLMKKFKGQFETLDR